MGKGDMPPIGLPELVSQMRGSYEIFLQACEQLSKEQALIGGVCGEWSAKAVLDHLTGWQVRSLFILKQVLNVPDQAFNLDIDAFNNKSVQDRQNLTWEESLSAFKLSFNAFDQALGDIQLDHYRTNQALISWVKAMTHEYQFHLEHIQKALAR